MKFIAIAALIGTITAIQLGAVPLDAKKNPIKTGKKEAGTHGNGAVDQSPEPPLTKVYQEVDMSSKCSNGVCHVKECFDGKCKTYDKKQPPKFEFQKPDTNWKGKDQKKEATEAPAKEEATEAPVKTEDKTEDKAAKQEAEKEKEVKKEQKHKVDNIEALKKKQGSDPSVLDAKVEEKENKPKAGAGWAHKEQDSEKESEPTQENEKAPHLTIPEKATPSSSGSSHTKAKIADHTMIQNGNLKAINSMIKEVKNRPPTEANKLLLDGIVDDTMIDMDIYSGKKTKEAADILKDKTLAMVKSSEIEQEMVQTNSVLNNIEKLLAKSSKK